MVQNALIADISMLLICKIIVMTILRNMNAQSVKNTMIYQSRFIRCIQQESWQSMIKKELSNLCNR